MFEAFYSIKCKVIEEKALFDRKVYMNSNFVAEQKKNDHIFGVNVDFYNKKEEENNELRLKIKKSFNFHLHFVRVKK